MNAQNTAPAVKDKWGFPLTACTRCGGGGEYSFNLRHGKVCYGCGGTGWQHPRGKVSKAFKAFLDAVTAQRKPTVGKLAAGDVITFDLTFGGGVAKGATWRTVAAVTVTPKTSGYSIMGDGPKVYSYVYAVTFADGGTELMSENLMCIRKGAVDPAPFLAMAGVKPAK